MSRLEPKSRRGSLKGKRVLVTGGATSEPIDPIRIITSRASGKTGVKIAEEARRRGAEVTLVHGRSVGFPASIRGIGVETVEEMIGAVLGELERGYDVLINSAAISDFTADAAASKIKSDGEVTIRLKPARKLVKAVREKYPNLPIVGFKAETNISEAELVKRAKKSMDENKLSFVVANDVGKGGMGTDTNEVVIVDGKGVSKVAGDKSKIARAIIDKIEKILG